MSDLEMKNVLDFGAVPDGKTLSTYAVRNAIASFKEEGGVLFFPKGDYVLSTVYLRSNIILRFEKGARILGSLDFNDFDRDEKVDYPLYQDASHSFFHCSLFVGENCENIAFEGGYIDMRSVWDEENIRGLVNRGCKAIALKYCKNFHIDGTEVYHATDLGIYMAGCEHGLIENVKMITYIDGISPDSSNDIEIRNCDIEAGDDGIVLKASYTLNKLQACQNIYAHDCRIKSQCNAIKLGTESNGDFLHCRFENIDVTSARISGISVESVDGGHIDDISFENIHMQNVGAPLFIMLGDRLRGPKGSKIGSISNICFRHISSTGPYHAYDCVPYNYITFKENRFRFHPGFFSYKEEHPEVGSWQIASNFFGLIGHPLKNIVLEDVYLELDGGVKEFNREVPEDIPPYPEVNVHGKILPAVGIYGRHIDGLSMKDVRVSLLHEDARESFIFDDTNMLN